MGKIFRFETDHITELKSIMEVLNGFVDEVNAECIKDVDKYMSSFSTDEEKLKKEKSDLDSNAESDEEENKGIIKIMTNDGNTVMMTHIILYGKEFSKFEMLPDEYSIGLNINELSKYFKHVDKDGTMTISMDSDDVQNVIFSVEKNGVPNISTCELRVLNLGCPMKRKAINATFTMVVRMNCSEFHKACKDLNQYSSHVEFQCTPNMFSMICKGDISSHKRVFGTGNGKGVNIKIMEDAEDNNTANIVRLIFDFKHIKLMSRCSNLCEDILIYLKNDSVMFLEYTISTFAKMLVGIAPASIDALDNNDDYSENDDQFYSDEEIDMLVGNKTQNSKKNKNKNYE